MDLYIYLEYLAELRVLGAGHHDSLSAPRTFRKPEHCYCRSNLNGKYVDLSLMFTSAIVMKGVRCRSAPSGRSSKSPFLPALRCLCRVKLGLQGSCFFCFLLRETVLVSFCHGPQTFSTAVVKPFFPHKLYLYHIYSICLQTAQNSKWTWCFCLMAPTV